MAIIQGIFIIFLEVLYCTLFLEIFLDRRIVRYKYTKQCVLVMITFGLVIIASSLGGNIALMAIKEVLVILFTSSTMLIIYKSKKMKMLFLILIYFGILLGIDYLAIIVIKYMLPPETMTYLNNPLYGTIFVLLCRTIVFGAIIIIKKNWDKNNNLNLVSDSQWLRFIYFPIMSILALCAMLINFDIENSDIASNTLLIIAFGLVIMNLMVFYLMRDIITREKLIQNDKIFKERMKSQTNMYRSMSDNFEIQRKRIHEYNNQIGCIEGMLINRNVEQALEYVEKISGGLKKEGNAIDTNNVIINAIINSKYKEALEKNIVMVIKVNDLSTCVIADEDIVIILSNLLNNAIEACEKIMEKRIIWLKFVNEENMMIISVKNTVIEDVEIIDDVLITTKTNTIEHGLGVKNIKESVEKYKGSYSLQAQDRYFFFSIIIPRSAYTSKRVK